MASTVSPISLRVASISLRIRSGSSPIRCPPSRFQRSVRVLGVRRAAAPCGRARASTAPIATHRTVTISAASHSGMAVSSAAVRTAVSAMSASSAGDRRAREHARAAAGELALGADLGLRQLDLLADERRRLAGELFDELTDRALAHARCRWSTSTRYAPVRAPGPVCCWGGRPPVSDSSRSGTGTGVVGRNGREDVAIHVGATRRQARGALLLVVAAAARRLQEARRRDAEHHAAGHDGPGPVAAEPLGVAEDRVAVGALEVVAESATRAAALSANSAGLSLPSARRCSPTERTSLATPSAWCPTCVERVSTSSRTRWRAWPAAWWAFSCAWPAASWALALAPPESGLAGVAGGGRVVGAQDGPFWTQVDPHACERADRDGWRSPRAVRAGRERCSEVLGGRCDRGPAARASVQCCPLPTRRQSGV